jgi:uncharacterized protein (TIGR03067 family)
MLKSIAFLIAFALLCGHLRADDGAKKALAELEGVWKLTRIEAGGEARDLNGKTPHWTFKGKKVSFGGEPLAEIVADAGGVPKSLDLTLAGEKDAREGIYAIDGDTLKICVNWDTGGLKERPQEFASKDKASFRVLEFARVKDPKEEDTSVQGFVGLQLKAEAEKVVVVATIDNSPAKTAGFEPDDIVVEVGGAKVATLLGAIESVRGVKPGSEVIIAVERKGAKKEIRLKVGLVPMRLLLD